MLLLADFVRIWCPFLLVICQYRIDYSIILIGSGGAIRFLLANALSMKLFYVK